jgi:hypothetical protein
MGDKDPLGMPFVSDCDGQVVVMQGQGPRLEPFFDQNSYCYIVMVGIVQLSSRVIVCQVVSPPCC